MENLSVMQPHMCGYHHKYSDYLSPHGAPKKFKEAYPMEFQYAIAEKLFNQYKEEKNV